MQFPLFAGIMAVIYNKNIKNIEKFLKLWMKNELNGRMDFDLLYFLFWFSLKMMIR